MTRTRTLAARQPAGTKAWARRARTRATQKHLGPRALAGWAGVDAAAGRSAGSQGVDQTRVERRHPVTDRRVVAVELDVEAVFEPFAIVVSRDLVDHVRARSSSSGWSLSFITPRLSRLPALSLSADRSSQSNECGFGSVDARPQSGHRCVDVDERNAAPGGRRPAGAGTALSGPLRGCWGMGKAAHVVPGASSQAAGTTPEGQEVFPVSLGPRVAPGASSPGPSGHDGETPGRSRTSSVTLTSASSQPAACPDTSSPPQNGQLRSPVVTGRPLDINDELVRAL